MKEVGLGTALPAKVQLMASNKYYESILIMKGERPSPLTVRVWVSLPPEHAPKRPLVKKLLTFPLLTQDGSFDSC